MALINRRRLLIGVCMASAVGLLKPQILPAQVSNSGEAEERQYSLRWRVNKAHIETVRDNLVFEGEIEIEKDQKGLPLVFVFVGVVLLPYLADAVLALRRDMVYGGLLIDARGPEVVIENDQRIDGGTIVVVTAEGTEIYYREDIRDPSELISALLKP